MLLLAGFAGQPIITLQFYSTAFVREQIEHTEGKTKILRVAN